MPGKPSKQSSLQVIWSERASKNYHATLLLIAAEDVGTLDAFEARVRRALGVLSTQPGIGTKRTSRGVRVFPIPNTGHTIEYRVENGSLLILRWYRQRRKRP